MRKKISVLCAAFMALSGVNVVSPALAASIPAVKMDAGTQIVDVQERRGNRGYYNHNGRGYYNGHRGHRTYRRGWRSNNGWWFPPAAFITGAIIGGAIANDRPPPVRYRSSLPSNHVSWCYDRYRSYRQSDNSFQPYNGPRRQCRSPYY